MHATGNKGSRQRAFFPGRKRCADAQVVHAVLPLERGAEAHALVAKNVGFGKIVLDFDCGAGPG